MILGSRGATAPMHPRPQEMNCIIGKNTLKIFNIILELAEISQLTIKKLKD
nr:MAG TPA: hypothetical protein [Caudoviricetes sp.]